MESNYSKNHLVIKQFCKIAFCIVFLFILKLKFLIGIDGIELVTFTVCFYALFLRYYDCLIVIFSFNLLVLLFYGFGTWWFAYWIIWPTEMLLTKVLKKWVARNQITFSLWVGMWGFSICGWYFISDWIFLGYSVALANFPSAIIVNTIELAVNFTFALFAFKPLLHVVDKLKIADLNLSFFKPINLKKENQYETN